MMSFSGAQNEEAAPSGGGITIMDITKITQPMGQMKRE